MFLANEPKILETIVLIPNMQVLLLNYLHCLFFQSVETTFEWFFDSLTEHSVNAIT